MSGDRIDRLTLRFVDPTVERTYQESGQAEGVRRARASSVVGAMVWLTVALVGPAAVGVDPAPTWLISGSMIAFSLACAIGSRWATTQRRRDTVGLGQQLVAAIAVLALTWATGTFAVYAMPGVMLTAVFGFAVTRPPFVGAIALGIAYCLLFLAAAAAWGLGPPLMLQMSILVATVVSASIGAYLLERSDRATYVQARLVQALHERVDRLLRQYLSPDVASTLILDPDRAELGGVEAEVTVLFADLRGYTTYAEHRAPADVVMMLNDAFGAAVPMVLAEGGTVVQFMGDAMMVVFNAPNPQADHALRAATAALSMQRAVAAAVTAPSVPGFRVGINTGLALVGNIGSPQVRNFSAIGDTTNLAARLQTFAPEGSVVISAATYAQIRDRARVRSLGSPVFKGKSEPIEVYELLSLDGPMGA